MPRLTPSSDTASRRTLFRHLLPRYLRHPSIRDFLMDASQPHSLSNFSAALSSSISYACLYIPTTSVPHHRQTSSPTPVSFLDSGDIMLFDSVYDGIAVGHVCGHREELPLAVFRDKMMQNSHLSRVPKVRKFACDISATNFETIEFAWLMDHSLIISCRHLDKSRNIAVEDQLVLSGDVLFYDIIPQGLAPDVPLWRMTFAEKPAICQFCGARGIKTCSCPGSFKSRAPSTNSVPVPYSHTAFEGRDEDTELQIIPPGPLARNLATWDCYAKRVFDVKVAGSFFINWYRRSNTSSGMELFLSPRHPISYQFICGTREQTKAITTMYFRRLTLFEKANAADARLYEATSPVSNIATSTHNKNSSQPSTSSLLGLEDLNDDDYFDISVTSSADCMDRDYPVSEQSFDLAMSYPNSSTRSCESPTSMGGHLQIKNYGHRGLEGDAAEPHPNSTIRQAGEEIAMVEAVRRGPVNVDSVEDFDVLVAFDGGNVVGGTNVIGEVHPGGRANVVGESFVQDAMLKDLQTGAINEEVYGLNISDVVPNNAVGVLDSVLDMCNEGKEKKDDKNAAPQNAANRKSQPPNQTQRLTLSTTSREIQQYMTVDASNTPTCNQCGSRFPKRGNLARHIQTVHLKLKPFQCEHCPASFGYKNHLKRHQVVHQRGGEVKCQTCNRDFKGQIQLSRHVKQMHQKGDSTQTQAEAAERFRISCQVCDASFSQRSNLSRHMLIHEGLRFVCPVCPKRSSFRQRYDLHRHIERKHPEYPDSSILSITPQREDRVNSQVCEE